MSESAQITSLLQQWQNGDNNAQEHLFHIVHKELRRIAGGRLKNEFRPHSLQATELVHEIYPQLARQRKLWQNRGHFYAIASECMRRYLVDHARSRTRQKRGGDNIRLSLSDLKPTEICHIEIDEEVLAVDNALTKLAEIDEKAATVVKHRYFGGMKREEIAKILEVSPTTVDRTYRFAKAWLKRELAFEFSPYLLSDGQIIDKPGFIERLKSDGGNELSQQWREVLPPHIKAEIDAQRDPEIQTRLLSKIVGEINKSMLGKMFFSLVSANDSSGDKTEMMPDAQIKHNRQILEKAFAGQILKLA